MLVNINILETNSMLFICYPIWNITVIFSFYSLKKKQVWFQNARAKYRRNMLKSDPDKPNQGGSQSSDQSAVSPDDDKLKDDQSISELTELDDSQSPDAMSDISSTPSLSDLHSNTMESDHSTSSLSDLFTNSINSLSWGASAVVSFGVKYIDKCYCVMFMVYNKSTDLNHIHVVSEKGEEKRSSRPISEVK